MVFIKPFVYYFIIIYKTASDPKASAEPINLSTPSMKNLYSKEGEKWEKKNDR